MDVFGNAQEERLGVPEQQGGPPAQPLNVAPPLWVPPSRQDEQARLEVEIPLEQECRQLAQDVVQRLQQQAAAAEEEAAAAHAASQHAAEHHDRPAFDAAQAVAAAAQQRQAALTRAAGQMQEVQSILQECVTQVGGINFGRILLCDARASLSAAAGLSGEQLAAQVGALLSRVAESCSISDMLEACLAAGLGSQLTALLLQCPDQALCSAEAGEREAQATAQHQEAYLQQRHLQRSGGSGGSELGPEPQLVRVVDGAGPSRRTVAVEGWHQAFEMWRSKIVDMCVELKYIAESAAIGLSPNQRDVLVQLDRLARLAHEGEQTAQAELERAVMANVSMLSGVMEQVKVLVWPGCIRHVVCTLGATVDDLSVRCKDLVHGFTGASIALDTAGRALEQGHMPPAAAAAGSGAEHPTTVQLMQQGHELACAMLNPFAPDAEACLSRHWSADEKWQLVAAVSTGAHREQQLKQLQQQVDHALRIGHQWVRGSVAQQHQMLCESLRQGAEVAQILLAAVTQDGRERQQQQPQYHQVAWQQQPQYHQEAWQQQMRFDREISAHLYRQDDRLAAIQEQLNAVQQQQQQLTQILQGQQAWLADRMQ